MKANEIKTGGKYLMKVNGTVQTVRVDSIRDNYAGRTVYDVTNLATGRRTMARSAAKFRGEVIERKLVEPTPESEAFEKAFDEDGLDENGLIIEEDEPDYSPDPHFRRP